jgi:hypothetical protein
MSPTLTCLALALAGANLGFRPAPDGGTDFIFHVNPATLQASRPGNLIELAVERDAQGLRPSHFYITPSDERLPNEVFAPASLPQSRAPAGLASQVIPAVATSSALPSYVPPLGAPASTPPFSAPAEQSGTRPGARANSGPAEPKIGDLAPVIKDASGSSVQADRPWLLMCLLVIALLASNSYVGWLFWDARQRYRGLLARTFSLGQQAAEG